MINKLTTSGFLFVKYGVNCGLVLGSKLALTYFFLLICNPHAAYALAHIFVFFVSYGVHTYLTFQSEPSIDKLKEYFLAVIGFKIADYFIFSVLFTFFEITALIAVVAASLSIMILRFIVARKILEKKVA